MIAHEPGHDLRLGGIETETRSELHRDLGPEFAMISAPALGDVVKEDGHIERPARSKLLE